MSKKICLIYTGGTIGMVREEGGALRPPDDPSDFLRVAPELAGIVDFDFEVLMNKDSTNMNPSDWACIAERIYALNQGGGYDGFVVAHGTDTMHFTASAVAFALGRNLNFPVVFTGAQTIPEVSHGDARVNLIRAFEAAKTDLAEVAISFGDYIFRGCRAQKKDERRFDAFESPSFPAIGFVTEKIVLSGFAKRRRPECPEIDLCADFADEVLQVSLIPGLEPELLQPILKSGRCNGVILQSFGAGNVPNEGPFSFVDMIRKARYHNMPVIITSQFPAGATLHTAYAPGRAAVQAGAIATGNMTSSCAAAKFRWVLAKVERQIREGQVCKADKIDVVDKLMQEIFIDEMDEPRS